MTQPASKKVQKFERFSKANRNIESEHAKIHDGNAYAYSIQSSLTSAGSFTILLRNPASYFPHYRNVRIRPEAGPAMFTMYEAPVIDSNSLGTVITINNMNRASSNTTSLAAYTGPVTNVASLGIQMDKELIPATGVQGGGIASPTPFEFILGQSTDYILVFESQGGNTQMTYTSFFYELS